MAKHERNESQDKEHPELRHPSTKRAKEIDEHTPLEEVNELLSKQKTDSSSAKNVLHWFRSKDLRMEDNKALAAASAKAQEGQGSLLTMYLFSPADMEWHGTSPARSDFILEGLKLLKKQLADKNIPLALVTAEERSDKVDSVAEFVKKHDVSHVYANLEYEVDELRRDKKLVKVAEKDNSFVVQLFHDQTAMEPGAIKTGSGGPLKVFTPYHKAWLSEMAQESETLLHLEPEPDANDKKARETFKELFDSQVPSLPKDKQFASKDEEKRIRELWPPGHDAGMKRLDYFLTNKVGNYAVNRSEPAKDVSSRMSAYFSAGMVSVREVLAEAKKRNDGKNFDDSGDAGIASWVREIVFREFYRQMLVVKPHNAMNLPQNLKFNFVQWEDDEEGWKKWYEGKTGYPFIDAGMRQLNTEAYMANRLRMNTSSFLRTNLLIDYRRGERYFAEHLIDWDLANNTQGWEPSYTVFNPLTQSERCDPHGEFIRKWVPELKDVEGKAVFAPYDRLSKEEFEKLGYPEPCVDFAETKDRAIKRYKQDLANAVP